MSGSIGGNLNYAQISNTMGQQTSDVENRMRDFMGRMDPANASDMMQMQMMSQQWTLAVQMQSTTMKMIGDALKGVVQKIG